MAAPKKNTAKPDDPRQADTRAAIKTRQLINRLQNFALGEKELTPNKAGETKEIELDPNRIRSIEILLRKALPDLSAVTHANDADNPLIRDANELTDAELEIIIAGSGSALVTPETRPEKLN